MLSKNQTVTLACGALGADFEGICRHDGQVVFVRGALPGETVRAVITKAAKKYAVGKLIDVFENSPERISPRCPAFPRCGGCAAQHLAYPATLAHKRLQVADCLLRIGAIEGPNVLPAAGMEFPWRYRNKAAFPVGGTPGRPYIGCYAERSHDIVDTKDGCLLQAESGNALVFAVRRWIEKNAVAPYDETTHTGLLRHIVTREAHDGGAMLILAINGKRLPAVDDLVRRAVRAAPALRSVVLNENTRRTNVIFGDALHTLWGDGALIDSIAGFQMRVSPRSFFQVNRKQAERLFEIAISFAGLSGNEKVWDVYCGCGSITLPLARNAGHVTGVEVVGDAVRDARENASRNGVRNVSFLSGAAEDVLPRLAKEQGAPDVVVVDPPRKGCAPGALSAIVKASPQRIVYISCNPATLSRDAAFLLQNQYALQKVQPVDLFCWTGHVECVALLLRVG